MAADTTVAYVHAEKDGRLTFHRPDGSEAVVGQKPYETDDPTEIAFLDSLDFVKRQTKSGGKD